MKEPRAKRAKLEPLPREQHLPFPAACIIAQYLSPYQLLKAAQVSRAWYARFTGDAAWVHCDVYGVKRGICAHYLETKPYCTLTEWNETSDSDSALNPNLYLVVARLRRNIVITRAPPQLYFAPKTFYEALARQPLPQDVTLNFRSVSPYYHGDKSFVLTLLKAGFSSHGLRSDAEHDYALDSEVALCCTRAEDFDFDASNVVFDVDILKDLEVAKHAVRLNINVFQILRPAFDRDPLTFRALLDIFIDAVTHCRLQGLSRNLDDTAQDLSNQILKMDMFETAQEVIISNRELALHAILHFPCAIRSVSAALQNDWQVLWGAVIGAVRLASHINVLDISPEIRRNERLTAHIVMIQIAKGDSLEAIHKFDKGGNVNCIHEFLSHPIKREQGLHTTDFAARLLFDENVVSIDHLKYWTPRLRRLVALAPVDVGGDDELISRMLDFGELEDEPILTPQQLRCQLLARCRDAGTA